MQRCSLYGGGMPERSVTTLHTCLATAQHQNVRMVYKDFQLLNCIYCTNECALHDEFVRVSRSAMQLFTFLISGLSYD